MKNLCTIIVVLCLCVPAMARDYCVSTTGRDTWTGTSLRPFRTLARIEQINLRPADRVLLRRGGVWGETLTLGCRGTATAPIVLDAYGTGALPRITGLTLQKAAHVTVRNIRVSTSPADGVAIIYSDRITLDTLSIDSVQHGITGYYPSNVTVRNCTISGCRDRGLYFAYADACVIERNRLSNNSRTSADSFSLDVIVPLTACYIRDNTVTGATASTGLHNGGIRLDGDGIGDGSCSVNCACVVSGNTVTGGQQGIQLVNWSGAVVRGNTITQTTAYGLMLQRQPGGVVAGNIIEGNTITPASGKRAVYWEAGTETDITY
jgi:parallel beta-helix repeat protein